MKFQVGDKVKIIRTTTEVSTGVVHFNYEGYFQSCYINDYFSDISKVLMRNILHHYNMKEVCRSSGSHYLGKNDLKESDVYKILTTIFAIEPVTGQGFYCYLLGNEEEDGYFLYSQLYEREMHLVEDQMQYPLGGKVQYNNKDGIIIGMSGSLYTVYFEHNNQTYEFPHDNLVYLGETDWRYDFSKRE